MERTIKVTGKGKVSVKPDLIRFFINLEGTYEKYEEALRQSSNQTEQLKICFERIGFSKEDLKTVSFHVDTTYENYQDKKNVWKKKFIGYKFVHAMKIEFNADNQLLGKVLYAMAQCPVTPEFQIIYTIKDEESAKNLLLSKAVEDSKKKAQILAAASETSLGEILSIDYSWEEILFTSRPINRMLTAPRMFSEDSCEAYDMNIEPDNIEVNDTVTVIWNIH